MMTDQRPLERPARRMEATVPTCSVAKCENPPACSSESYCLDCLSDAFDRVKHPTDWKAPICAVVESYLRDVVRAAVIFYTATVPTFSETAGRRHVQVRAAGYRMGPAGP
jgi:hypothetical protein